MSLKEVWSNIQQSFQSGTLSPGPRELAEIRHDIIEEIRGNVQELSVGRYVFPYRHILVEILPRTPPERAAIQAIWIDGGELQSDIFACLARADCQYDRNLIVETRFGEASASPDPAKTFWLTFGSATRQGATAPSVELRSPICLSVLTGAAEPDSITLSARVTNLGRLREVFDQAGQLVRFNDLAFSDVENGVNETVGRTHAHVTRLEDGGFALSNSRRSDKTPTAIIRYGRSIPVILIAEPIEPGDVIQLGRARLAVS